MSLKITLSHENGKDSTECVTFGVANSVLRRWSNNSHPTLGYDKIDFTITDPAIGLSYQGRYDLQHWGTAVADLGAHVLEHLEFISGTRRPSHVTDERYQAYIAHFSAEMRERAAQYHDLIASIIEGEYVQDAPHNDAPAPA